MLFCGLLTSALCNTKLILLSLGVFTDLILLLLQFYLKYELIDNVSDGSSVSD